MTDIRQDAELIRRGTEKAAHRLGWRQHRYYDGRDGYLFPVQTEPDRARLRWRSAVKGDADKYRWHDWIDKPADDEDRQPVIYATLYDTILQAIAADNGRLYITNGELATLSMVQAGIDNVMNFTGESAWYGSRRSQVIDFLRQTGVRHIVFYPDRDSTGLTAAAHMVAMVDQLDNISLTVADLSALLPDDKDDINDLWIACEFNSNVFLHALSTLPVISGDRLPALQPARHDSDYTAENTGDLPESLITAVVRALGVEDRWQKDGYAVKAVRCPVGNHQHDDKRPAAYWNKDIHALTCHKCGQTYGTHTVAESMGIDVRSHYPDRQPTRVKKARAVDLSAGPDDRIAPAPTEPAYIWAPETFTPDITFNSRFISDHVDIISQADTAAIKSPIASGKTELVIRLIQARKHKRVLYVTALENLNTDTTDRFNKAGLEFELYNNLPSGHGSVSRLATTINSIYKIGTGVTYDLIVFDEFRQSPDILNSDAMSDADALTNFDTLLALLTKAKQVITLDATLDNRIVDKLLTPTRKNVIKIHNEYTPDRGTLQNLPDMYSVIAYALEVVCHPDTRLPVVITSGTQRDTRLLERLGKELLGADAVLAIHGKNSRSPQSRAAMKDLNAAIARHRLVILSPSVGTGFDIQTPVALVAGIYINGGKGPGAVGIIQHMMRCRNAQKRVVFTPKHNRELEIDEDVIFQQVIDNAHKTRAAAGADDLQLTGHQIDLARLRAYFIATDNASKRNLRQAVNTLARAEGFKLTGGASHPDVDRIKELMTAQRQSLKDWELNAILTEAPVSNDDLRDKLQRYKAQEVDFFGNVRWKIEQMIDETITEDSARRFKSGKNRAALRRMAGYLDFIDDPDSSRQGDRDDLSTKLLHRLNHRTRNNKLFAGLLSAVFGADGLTSEEVIVEEELVNRANDFITQHRVEITALDGRDDLSTEIVATVRRLLKRFGVSLGYKRVRVTDADGNRSRQYSYFIDHDDLRDFLRYVDRYREAVKRRQQEVSQNAEIGSKDSYSRDLGQRPDILKDRQKAPRTGVKIPPAPVPSGRLTADQMAAVQF